ncbi:MAG: hypothetical protein ACI4II_09995 [Acutalibacteraceae bacterium]
MCLGKSKCKILKEIRQKIADENDIPYITSECTHKGDCLGTCPKCEQELQYLEKELKHRNTSGEKVVISAHALSVDTVASGCDAVDTLNDNNFMTGIVSAPAPSEYKKDNTYGMAGMALAYSEHNKKNNTNENSDNDFDSNIIELAGDVAYNLPDNFTDEKSTDSDNSCDGDSLDDNCSSDDLQ